MQMDNGFMQTMQTDEEWQLVDGISVEEFMQWMQSDDEWQLVDDYGISVEELMHECEWIENYHMVEERMAPIAFMDIPQHATWTVEALLSEVRDTESGLVEPVHSQEPLVHVPVRGSVKKKGDPWTHHEHKLFLIGLEKYGRGDWKSISRLVVVSRTPAQVASHAQKYFIRLRHAASGELKRRKRTSIFDITEAENTMPALTNFPG